MIDKIKKHYESLDRQGKEIFGEELVLFLDEKGYPAPNLIRERAKDQLIKRYQNAYGDLLPQNQRDVTEWQRELFSIGQELEILFKLEDDIAETN